MKGTITMPYATLNDLFILADISLVEYTDWGTVILELTVRQTGARILVEGDDLDDACEQAYDLVEDQVVTVTNILDDYGLSLPELRAMVDFNPKPAEPVEPIVQHPLQVVAAAQPFLATDGTDRLYLVLEVIGPEAE